MACLNYILEKTNLILTTLEEINLGLSNLEFMIIMCALRQ